MQKVGRRIKRARDQKITRNKSQRGRTNKVYGPRKTKNWAAEVKGRAKAIRIEIIGGNSLQGESTLNLQGFVRNELIAYQRRIIFDFYQWNQQYRFTATNSC